MIEKLSTHMKIIDNSKGTIGIEYGDTLITDKFWIENRNIHDFDEYCFFHPIE